MKVAIFINHTGFQHPNAGNRIDFFCRPVMSRNVLKLIYLKANPVAAVVAGAPKLNDIFWSAINENF